MADRFFIGPYDKDSGLQTNYKPWVIADQAFAELNNAYVFRGRVRKRFGSRWLGNTSLESRLRVLLGVTPAAFAGNVRTITNDAAMSTAVGQAFSIGNIVFTVVNPAAGPQQMLRTDNVVAAATYDLTTSAFNIVGAVVPAGTAVYFYPSLPVMGLLTFEQNTVNDEFVIAFDQRFAYEYNAGWVRLAGEVVANAAHWTGDNSKFFWACTWTGTNASDKVFFVTNFNETEPNFMRAFSTVAPFTNRWNNFRPQVSATEFLNSARIIVPFKNRLLAFNTWESVAGAPPGNNYVNRCRYSQIGSPLDVNGWRQDIPGRGNAIDAPTTESIITVEFIRDRLIVFFERSTYELVYIGNQAYPFAWQQINTELGAESTFSVVPFDKVALGVGNVGIHACSGTVVERIDDKIPNTVFDIHNANQGVFRVYGIRDFYVEMVYWTFPDTQADADYPYPNRVLIYNYKTGTWAFNADSITCFGYFQPISGVLWDSTTVTWDDDIAWDSGSIQAKFRQVVAGNQEGYTFICDADVTTNASVLQITNIFTTPVTTLTIVQHNLRQDEYIYIEGATYDDASNGLNNHIFQVSQIIDVNTIELQSPAIFTGNYIGGGLVSRVSQISIKTKEYNFYAKQGRNAYVSKIDFMVDKTAAGQIQVEFYVSTATTSLLQDSAANGSLLGTGTLDTFPYTVAAAPIPFEATASRLWHPVYFDADGEVIQLQLIMNDAQMKNVAIRNADFQLHALCISAQPTSYRFQ